MKKCFVEYKQSRDSTNDAGLRRLKTSTTDKQIHAINRIILGDMLLTVQQIANPLILYWSTVF